MTQAPQDRRRLDAPVPDFAPPTPPGPPAIAADWGRLERLDPARHAAPLFAACGRADRLWDYMPYGPFRDLASYRDWQDRMAVLADPCFYAIIDPDRDVAAGLAAFLRVDPGNGVIEIGHILLPPALQRSRLGSAGLMAMIGWAFEAGYRRVEWKCNALNAGSRRAALRLGFSFEGVFRQHLIVKGRNRDSAWFSIIDGEWPALRAAHARWLDPRNFDAEGRQRVSLSDLTAAALPGRSDG